jgi:dephospho-CoA kinase
MHWERLNEVTHRRLNQVCCEEAAIANEQTYFHVGISLLSENSYLYRFKCVLCLQC